MRGGAIRAYGEGMVLMDDLPVPTLGPHDILMQMRSAEVGDWDELVRTGAWDMQRPFPLILGLAGAGRIAAVGTAVTDFSANQLVYAYSYPLHDNGAWAEFMLVPETYVAPIPASLTPVEAGGVPIVGLTAHETLIDVLRVTGDDVVLINAAAGGVGHIAVQLASSLGAQVVAAASRRNLDFVAGLGAVSVIDYDATGDGFCRVVYQKAKFVLSGSVPFRLHGPSLPAHKIGRRTTLHPRRQLQTAPCESCA
jgi:NADPH:quinone reductase-like Zn-dependent oxidoreductase